MDGEDRERKMIEDQIARARSAAEEEEVEQKGLERKEGEKISLSLFPKPEASSSEEKKDEAGPSAPAEEKKPMSFGSFGKMPVANPLKPANPLKRPAAGNVFKSAKVAKTDDSDAKPKGFRSEAGAQGEQGVLGGGAKTG
jgi:DNA/RNA-binding protein KIN17